MGRLAKYNPKPPPHGHAQAFNCTHSVNTLAHTLFFPTVHTLQQAHLQSRRTAQAHTLISQHTINTSVSVILLRSLFIHARHTRRFACYFCLTLKPIRASWTNVSAHYDYALSERNKFVMSSDNLVKFISVGSDPRKKSNCSLLTGMIMWLVIT